jgi:hypothetical protein
MKKSPELTVIGTGSGRDPREPPAGLGEAGSKLWNDLHRDYEIIDASGLEMLRQICCTVDRVAEYSATIERDGPMLKTRAGVKDHPLIRHVQTGRSFIVRSLHKLGLDIIEPRSELGRPSGGGDYRGERR